MISNGADHVFFYYAYGILWAKCILVGYDVWYLWIDCVQLPAAVTNVETIVVPPTIFRRGASWFAGFGRKVTRTDRTDFKDPYFRMYLVCANWYIIKLKIHSSCEIEDFVETNLCKLCVIFRSRVLRVLCVLVKDIVRRLPLQLQQCSLYQDQQGDVIQSVRGNYKTRSWGEQNLTAVEEMRCIDYIICRTWSDRAGTPRRDQYRCRVKYYVATSWSYSVWAGSIDGQLTPTLPPSLAPPLPPTHCAGVVLSCALLCPTLLRSTWRYPTLPFPTPLYFTLLYATRVIAARSCSPSRVTWTTPWWLKKRCLSPSGSCWRSTAAASGGAGTTCR